MRKGYLALVLHAHLPFVRHPEYPEFLEKDWLFEGITETYIPLWQVFEGLLRDGVPFRLTMSLTPTLCARELAQALVTMRATLESTTDAYLKRPEFSTFSPPTNGLRLTWPIFLESTIEASRAGIRCQCRGMANCFLYRCLQVCSSDNDDCGEM